MNSETKTFFGELFGAKDENDWALIWSKQGEQPKSPNASRWAKTVDEMCAAVHAAESACEGWHIYAGVLPRAKTHGRTKRGGVADTSALLALWVDIDIAGPGHKTTGKLPRDTAEALRLVEKIGVPASMLVHSGGGIHAYWILKEAWQFDTPAARDEAATLERAWLRTFQIHAATMGLVVDPTFDLARVLRVPGTTNWKGETPTECRLLHNNGNRYDPDELRAVIPPDAYTEKAPRAAASNPGAANFVLRADAEPPMDKVEALRQAEPKFDLSIKYQRTDFPKNDFTPSAYDFSLAAFAAYADWSEQEIADLLIWVRRTHGRDLRIDDLRYYVRTINIAVADAKRKKAFDELRGETVRVVGETPGEDRAGYAPAKQGTTDDKRRIVLDYISQVFGCRVKRVIKYVQDPPRYRLETAKSGIELGTVENLIGQTQIRNALAATDGHYLPKFKADDWEAVSQALLDACEIVNTGPESTDVGAVREWLNVYFDENPPGDLSDFSIKNQQPHFDGTERAFICFYLAHFRTWVFQRQNEKVSAKQLGILLRRIKGEPEQITHVETVAEGAPGKRTTRAVWRIPRNFADRKRKAKGTGDDGKGGPNP